jgi:adenine C2-methylase RlmN of 23S rRNA A2503 and tRNA A37
MKAWFLRWLGAVSGSEFAHARAEDNQRIRDEYRAVVSELKSEHEATIANLIQELNDVRNSIPATVAQNSKHQVRVLRNFREFRTVLEQKPIRIERTS